MLSNFATAPLLDLEQGDRLSTPPVRTVVAVPSGVLPAYLRLTFGLPGRDRSRSALGV